MSKRLLGMIVAVAVLGATAIGVNVYFNFFVKKPHRGVPVNVETPANVGVVK